MTHSRLSTPLHPSLSSPPPPALFRGRALTCVCVCACVRVCVLYTRANSNEQVAAVNVSFLVLFCQFYFKTYKKPRKAKDETTSNGHHKLH